MKNILCFGDSNTWGYIPVTGERRPRLERWTGILQKSLGVEDYYVIEAGLNGRTTVFDDPIELHRNGLKSLRVVLMQAEPVDLILVMLGTNDTKAHLGQSAFTIARGMELVIQEIQVFYKEQFRSIPKILLMSPIDIAPNIEELPAATVFDADSAEKMKELRPYYEEIAERYGCAYLDASLYGKPSELDGIHMNVDGHQSLAKAVETKVRELLK